ncbi:MAG: Outer rane autotransporter barrel [Proteobacteria bacterium]|nr:Outer rane autotransporter barrel [Pseudomonadota bacterium]
MKTHAFVCSNKRLISMAISAAFVPGAIAGPDACTADAGGTTLTCQGNQSQGINIGATPPNELIVHNLSQPITTSASGTSGIGLISTNGQNVWITAGESEHRLSIQTDGTETPGIYGASSGISTTPPPINTFLNVPLIGANPAVAGGDVRINAYSTPFNPDTQIPGVLTTGTTAHAIAGYSSGSGYSEAVLNTLRNFTETGFSFAVTKVLNASGTEVAFSGGSVQVRGYLLDANGNVLRDGSNNPIQHGTIKIYQDGRYEVSYSPDELTAHATLTGPLYIGVNYSVEGNRAGNTQTDNALLLITLQRDGNTLQQSVEASFDTFGVSGKPANSTTPSVFPDLKAYVTGLLNTAESGGSGNSVRISSDGWLKTTGIGAHGMYGYSQGGSGVAGRNGNISHSAGAGTNGSAAGNVTASASGTITTTSERSSGIVAMSDGGAGGAGGGNSAVRYGQPGGNGGIGGTINVSGDATITTSGKYATGIVAISVGGVGGSGGTANGAMDGANGGAGGQGGLVTVDGNWNVTTTGELAHGIWAKSLGGNGGIGGDGGSSGKSGGGGVAGVGNSVVLHSAGSINTSGSHAYGLYGQSVGGFGGTGGSSWALFWAYGASGSPGGNGGMVTVHNLASGNVTTNNLYSHGILAQSIGGGGGSGGGDGDFALFVNLGGDGSAGGTGNKVTVENDGNITTGKADSALNQGNYSHGIFAQSVGGGGGDGGGVSGLVSVGGKGSGTSNGGQVDVINRGTINTYGIQSHAIFAQSIGGGGGDGGSATGLVTIGGEAGDGGSANVVNVSNSGTLHTHADDSYGVFAQSIGGGGGTGGSAISAGVDVAVAIGGKGGLGGAGGAVNVTTQGSSQIITDGDRSHAIFAQSIGGGGGNGGFAISGSAGSIISVSVAVGGSGGSGGNADSVKVLGSGTIASSGEQSYGIFAQSVGGGGGSGGFAISSSYGGTKGLNLSLGGSGGTGGFGKTVDVGTEANPFFGTIKTLGDRSHGIFAQSIGGSGGDGGFAISGSIGGGMTANIAIGGNGGTGNDSDVVTVHSVGNITTGCSQAMADTSGCDPDAGNDAHAILAQSIGGSGGNGGFAISASLLGGVGLKLGIGGSGAGASDGNTVNVGSSTTALGGTLTTYGDRSHGIVAQSIGGGGGNGGASIAGDLLGPVALSLSFGGDAGGGGAGGQVNVHTNANIATHGEQSHGIVAQSIGGGGGTGGLSIAGGVTAFGGLALSMGGKGGDGDTADTVKVVNRGDITTEGEHSYGIMAQSIGGRGGAGGTSGSVMVNFSSLIPIPKSYPTGSVNISLSLGGDGGKGGVGGLVDVTNNGKITTMNDHAYGIYAQSIGGGGGDGGKGIAATANISLPDDPSGGEGDKKPQLEVKVDFAMAIGGAGGSGNNGGKVAVTNSKMIDTSGVGAHAIYAQSIGGGGGTGGDARAMILSIDPENWKPDQPEMADPTKISFGATLSVGGKAGAGGDAGEKVAVINSGSIVTSGADAFGIFAQSIGGGGGVGGSGYHGLDWQDFGVPEGVSELLDFVLPIQEESDVDITVGGAGGASGHGKEVFINHTGSITTTGQGSVAVLAQSIGGGGGIGGIGAIGDADSKQISFGGKGGSSGNGGPVHVIISQGEISTTGVVAHAIFAQSIGGGGGYAGNVDLGVTDFGNAFAFAGDGGNAGNGGQVTVENFGNIVTRGRGAMGIFAQSVGGGGGLGGTVGAGIGTAGSVGGTGAGGDVTVKQTGDISTYGDAAHGIVAQSNGGVSSGIYTGSAGVVTVSSSGNIVTNGAKAHGIVAQSLGGASNGDVIVNINDGSVTGGSGTGVGIMVLNGANNVITNKGTISALSGTALTGGIGSETLHNQGKITGNVDLGSGSNAINNLTDATFNSLTTIAVGIGRSLTNDGALSPGGSLLAQHTALTGNLLQNAGGSYNVDLSLAGRSSDHLEVSGSAQVGGSIRVTAIDTGATQIGNRQSVVLSAGNGVTPSNLTLIAPSSPIVTYALVYPSSNEIAVSSRVDFSPPSLGLNARQIGAHLNAIQMAGGSTGIAPLIAALVNLPDEASLRAAYEKLGPGALGNQAGTAAAASLGFNDAMHSCRQYDGDYRFIREGECSWFRLGGSIRDQERTDLNAGFKQDALTLAGGLQKAIRPDLHLGFGLSYQKSMLNSTYSNINGERFEGGLILKHRDGATRVSASLSAGYGHFNAQRLVDIVSPGIHASSKQDVWSASLQGRVSHDIMNSESAYIRPMLGLGVSYVTRNGYSESGAGGANLNVAKENDTFVSLQPAVEFGGEFGMGGEGTLLRHFIRLGATHFLGSNERRITASLEGAPAGVEPFTVVTRSDRTYGDLALGIDILRKSGTTLRIEYNGQFSANSAMNVVGIKFAMPF